MKKPKKSKSRMAAITTTRQTRRLRAKVIGAVVICLAIAASLYAIGRSRHQTAEIQTTAAMNDAGQPALCDSKMPSPRSMNHADNTQPMSETESDPSAFARP
jgi:hypothetical protein